MADPKDNKNDKEKEKETEKDSPTEGAQADGTKLNPKYLKGLVFSYAKHEEIFDKKLGKKKMVHTPLERALTVNDVMSWKDYGAVVVIATKDGKKYEVKK